MVTEQEACKWIGKSVDLMLSEYVEDPDKPELLSAFGMTGILEKVDEDSGEIWLVLRDDPKCRLSEGARAVKLSEVVVIEEGEETNI